MNFLSIAIENPRSTAPRKWLFRIHSWMGVVVCLYAVVIGVSGSFIVFREDFETPSLPHGQPVVASPGPDEIAGRVRRTFPNHSFDSLIFPDHPEEPISGYVIRDKKYTRFWILPEDGRVISFRENGTGPWGFLTDLHFNLLTGKTGRLVNGVGALALVVMSLTGLVIWWPGRPRWRQGFQIKIRAGWRRIIWDAHGVVGLISFVFILLLGVTGAYFAWPDAFRAAVGQIATIRNSQKIPEIQVPENPQDAPLSKLIEEAQKVVPDGHVSQVRVYEDPKRAARVILVHGGREDYGKYNYIFLNRYTGEVIEASLVRNRGGGDSIMAWIAPLHFGTFGGFWSKLAWVAFGLSLPTLTITGFLMWWKRVLSQKRKAPRLPSLKQVVRNPMPKTQ
jgi:uncharacterized iron-regulated membrane protein